MNALKRVTMAGVLSAALFNLSGCIVDRVHDHDRDRDRPREEVRYDDHYCDEGRGHDHDDHCRR